MKKTLKLLLVEDDQSDADLVVRQLEKENYQLQISRVDNANDFSESLKKVSWDLVISDFQLPGFDAPEALIIFKKYNAEIPFIVISGSLGEEVAVKIMKAGAHDYLTKDKLFKLASIVERELNEAANRRELQTKRQLLATAAKMSALGEMAGGIAHEINNPLTVIVGKVAILKNMMSAKEVDLAKCNEFIDRIEYMSMHIAKIVKGMKSFSRNSDQDAMEVISLKQVVDDTLQICEDRFKRHTIEFRLAWEAAENLKIRGRSSQILQVIINLLNNACDAIEIKSEKWVELKVSQIGTTIKIKITDSGKGISPDTLEKMLQPFFTTKPKDRGTGLGLSISRAIIEEHAGKFYYDDKSENTSFVMELPGVV